MSMDVVNLIFPNRNQLYFEIACVDEPAIESEVMMFNQVDFQFKEVEGEEGLMMGYLMIAEKEILRLDAKRGAYKVKFPKDTIDMMIENFQLNGLAKNLNLQHQTGQLLEGVFVRNHWQIDSKKGIVAPKGFKTEADGSWFIVVKCENEDVKQKFKDKAIKGFSLESKFIEEAIDKYFAVPKKVNDPLSFTKFPYNKFKNMKEEIKQAFEALIAYFSKDEKFEDLLLVDGVTKVTINPEVAVGSEFLILAEDGTAVKAPVLPEPYELQDGRKIMVEVEGVVATVTEPDTAGQDLNDDKKADPASPAPAQSDAVKRLIERIEKVSEFEKTIPAQALEIETLKTQNEEFKKTIEFQTKEIDALKTGSAELKTLIEENFKKLFEVEGKTPAAPQKKAFNLEKEKSIYPWMNTSN